VQTATPLVTATVTRRTRTEELEITVEGAPPLVLHDLGAREVFHPTGLRVTYRDSETTALTILTAEGVHISIRLDLTEEDPLAVWVTVLVDEHRPDPRDLDHARAWAAVAGIVDRARSKGVTALDTDTIAAALGLDDDEGQEPDVDGAGRTRAEYGTTTVDPCQPYQRYGCGHCRHQDCQNPDCGHCPCRCECH
jgi:hypothetical protein